ncbi:hypothetical protein ACVIHI_008411 [Bradyrhizobium sp. USDA 4524]|nr:hypothetical protein [Bradyrhizobium sp. USDA 4538]MCP1899228.1 hypothetical protein [Bradyrhizobium sp. USDA 4537]MCP1986660.1 hypothetical protein [Bradyrhizobium sp. USDA 4539]
MVTPAGKRKAVAHLVEAHRRANGGRVKPLLPHDHYISDDPGG